MHPTLSRLPLNLRLAGLWRAVALCALVAFSLACARSLVAPAVAVVDADIEVDELDDELPEMTFEAAGTSDVAPQLQHERAQLQVTGVGAPRLGHAPPVMRPPRGVG